MISILNSLNRVSAINTVIISIGNDKRHRLEYSIYLIQKLINTLGASLMVATVSSIMKVKRLVVTMDLHMQHSLINNLAAVTD